MWIVERIELKEGRGRDEARNLTQWGQELM